MIENKIPAGYKKGDRPNPAEEMTGPFYYKKNDDGQVDMAFVAKKRHCNTLKVVHGGILMTFGDYAITMQALSGVKETCTTVSFNCEFVDSGRKGDLIEARAEVVRRTGSLVFLRGQIFTRDQILLNFSGIVKRLQLKN